MTEFVLFIMIDIVLCGTGALLMWGVSLGRFKLFEPNRSSGIYWIYSAAGLIFWLLIAVIVLII